VVNQKVALYQLQKLGLTADAVDNGLHALEALRTKPYDVVLMDCQMPDLDGYAATRQLREIEGQDRHTWIVAMTANSLEGDREKCLATGMDDYISKPVKIEDLRAALERFSNMRRTESELLEEGGQSAIDLTVLNGFSDLDDDTGVIMAQLIEVFIDNTPKVIAEARQALMDGQFETLARAAHTLRGSCSNFGAERMRAVCQELEVLAHEGIATGAADLIATVEREFDCVRVALQRERPARAA
jgi:CheY-like chemotaxis protein